MRHLFLDIDNTMVCIVRTLDVPQWAESIKITQRSSVVKRPYLDSFLKTARAHYETVNLWTAGGSEYAKWIAQTIVEPVIGYPNLVLSDTHNTASMIAYGIPKRLKSLSEVWGLTDFPATQCLLVDDLEENCAGQNSILVPAFDGIDRDDVLDRASRVLVQASNLSLQVSPLCRQQIRQCVPP